MKYSLLPGTHSAADGALSTLFCATSPKAVECQGCYVVPYGKVDRKNTEKACGDGSVGEELWRVSEGLLRERGCEI